MSNPKAPLILVPVDFSPYSEAALNWANKIAQLMKARLVVLHVVHDLAEAPGYYSVKGRKKQLRRMGDVAAEMLEAFMAKMRKKHPESTAIKNAETRLTVGLPVNRILEVSGKLKPIMVVMGSQGRTGLAHVLVGSKAEQVVRLCKVPVTIVKHGGEQ